MPDPDTILCTHGLTVDYGRFRVIDDLNLNVPKGKIYGFLGRNGAGKTSTIRTIMGIVRASAGQISFAGQTRRRITRSQKRRIGYVSQEQYFYPWMTGHRLGKFVGSFYPTWDSGEY